jgi:hypothetical protein
LQNRKKSHLQNVHPKGHIQRLNENQHNPKKHKHNQHWHKVEKDKNWHNNSKLQKRRARNPPELPRGTKQQRGLALCPVQSLLYYLVGKEEYKDGSDRRKKTLNTRHETIYCIHCILKYSSMGKARESKQRQTRNCQ